MSGLAVIHNVDGRAADGELLRRDPEITRDLVELVGEDLLTVDAPNRIWEHGRFFNFPPTPLNVLLSCRFGEAGRIGLELMRARWRPRPCVSFKDFAVSQFGETLSRRLLLDYSEKFWGLPADQLSPDIATRRLQGMTLRSLLLELVAPGRAASHIDGKFLYPRRGYGQIIDRLKDGLPAQAARTGCEVARLECRGGAVTTSTLPPAARSPRRAGSFRRCLSRCW